MAEGENPSHCLLSRVRATFNFWKNYFKYNWLYYLIGCLCGFVSSLIRTMNRPLETYRTSIVRFVMFSTLLLAVVPIYSVSTAVHAQSTQQKATEGWLRLDSEQRRYRERAQPLEPRNEAYLEHLEHRQGLQLRESQFRQRQEREIERQRERIRYPDEPAHVPPRPRQGRELERQRLNRRTQRETFGAGRW